MGLHLAGQVAGFCKKYKSLSFFYQLKDCPFLPKENLLHTPCGQLVSEISEKDYFIVFYLFI
jgi:hypothetical protein